MASYFSSLLTTTTSRVATLRQNLLPSENDGDTLDDTHICRVLRAYYTEKGRPFPGWLPPDPKAPPPVVVQPVYVQSNIGAGYGGLNQGGAGRGSALSSLWDQQPQPSQQQVQGLRAGRTASPAARPAGNNPFAAKPQQSVDVQARPLPSQREGSYQNSRPDASTSNLSARERLKRGFNTAAKVGLVAQGNGQGSTPNLQSNNSYGSSGSAGGFDDRGAGGRHRSGAVDKPFVAATAPWASNANEFSGGGYSASGGHEGGRQRGGAPPNGPRGYR